jgi:hypothetical protein
VAALRGERDRALLAYRAAEEGFTAAGMALHAEVTSWARARLAGEAEKSVARIEARLVRHPDRLASVYAPGVFREVRRSGRPPSPPGR